jgi:hypothetical protein
MLVGGEWWHKIFVNTSSLAGAFASRLLYRLLYSCYIVVVYWA